VLEQGRIKGLSVASACRHLGVSRQGYYQQIRATEVRVERERQVVNWVQALRRRQPRIGARKLQHLLREPLAQAGIKMGRDALLDVLRRARLLVVPRRAYHKTTNSRHHFRRHPNLLRPEAAQVVATGAEQVWVADITYLPTQERCVYLSLVTDAYSRKIVGHHVHESLQTEEVAQALKAALGQRRGRGPLVHHSDRGIQYCASYYQAIHTRHGLTCSMTDGYDCYQNALAERVNGILKVEFLISRPQNLEEARRMVDQSVAIYNGERPHLSLQYKTPDAVHRASQQLQLQSAIRTA
jgi:transposase InsO family protein